MVDAWIDGEHASLDAAANEAAKLLRVSRLPLIAGLGTDVAGARAAIELAAQIGGVTDHMHSEPLLRDLDVAREAGMMVINAVGHLAEVAWHHPDITASYAWVEVRLQNHAAKGITDKDFELAKKIEEVVHWRPGTDSALEGTPAEDARFAYIKYDKAPGGGA